MGEFADYGTHNNNNKLYRPHVFSIVYRAESMVFDKSYHIWQFQIFLWEIYIVVFPIPTPWFQYGWEDVSELKG